MEDFKALDELKRRLRTLYRGRSQRAQRFRVALLAFDAVTVLFFLLATALPLSPWILAVDLVLGLVLLVELLARLLIARRKLAFLTEPLTLVDLLVILSLLLAPFLANLAFLRVLRALRLLRSYRVLSGLRTVPFIRRNEAVLAAIVNLAVFIFVVTAFVYVFQVESNPAINHYLDALYFTVTTLTTTGFGDITLEGQSGRILSVVIMVMGVALFLRLAQAIFRPQKVSFRCHSCGLLRHDPDAVHCKHCGQLLGIETEGD